MQGGSDKAVYYIGLAYYDENGMYKDTKLADYNSNTFYRRYNVTSNLTLNPFRTTEIKLGIQGYLANANYPASSQASIFESAYFTPPTYIAPLYPTTTRATVSPKPRTPTTPQDATPTATCSTSKPAREPRTWPTASVQRVTAPSIWRPQSTTATLSAGTPYRA